MPNYFYTAKTISGKTITGSAVAKDTRELAQNLKDEALILIDASLDDPKKKKRFSFSFGRIPVAEKIMMTKNLSVMVATGLPVIKSFDVLAGQTKNARLKSALLAVRDQVNKGENLHAAMAMHSNVFSDFFVSMVEVGEEAGTLEETLKIVSLQLEKEHRLKSQIQGAMIYPSIVLGLLLFVGIVIVAFVLPKLNDFFTSMSANLPFYTRALLWLGQWSTNNWPILIAIPIVFVFAILAGLKTKMGRWIKDTLFLRIPLVSSLVKKNNCAILIRSLSSLLGSGVTVTRSLEVAGGTVGNFYFRKAITEALEKIKKGEKLYEALLPYKDIFPFGAIEMLQVGEETGKTASVLKTLADFYEEELISATAKLSAAMEPILIVILGILVAFFAFSVIEPMYSSLQVIG